MVQEKVHTHTLVNAKLDNVRSLVTLLKCIHYKDVLLCSFNTHGIKFSVDASKSSQSHAYLPSYAFREYEFKTITTTSYAPDAPAVKRGYNNRDRRMRTGFDDDGDEEDEEDPLVNKRRRQQQDGRDVDMRQDEEELPSPKVDESDDGFLQFSVDFDAFLDCLCIFGGTSATAYLNHGSGKGGGGGGGGGDDVGGGANGRDGENEYPNQNNNHGGGARDEGRVSMTLQCRSDNGQMVLVLEEGGVVTVCKLSTFESEELAELDACFREQPIESKIIMQSQWLRDALQELDSTSDTIEILVSPYAPYFRLSASGIAGDVQMDYPKDTDVMESFQCQETRKCRSESLLCAPMEDEEDEEKEFDNKDTESEIGTSKRGSRRVVRSLDEDDDDEF
ncbi:ssDNA endodeoxyribonuclease [Chytridiales sp. JEL 0842]|nr:ssDNA endodeoxyribonuclease [Chytridiales sp. JEL 0842]